MQRFHSEGKNWLKNLTAYDHSKNERWKTILCTINISFFLTIFLVENDKEKQTNICHSFEHMKVQRLDKSEARRNRLTFAYIFASVLREISQSSAYNCENFLKPYITSCYGKKLDGENKARNVRRKYNAITTLHDTNDGLRPHRTV